MNIRNGIKKIINSIGYDIRPVSDGICKTRSDIRDSYRLISSLGFRPNTIIDVGVATGTNELYEAFPDAYLLLIEPLKEYRKDLEDIIRHYRGTYVMAAAGANSGQATFNVHREHLDGSSLLKETMGERADGEEKTVPVVTVDQVLRERQLTGPYLLKVDVQGAELHVLEGARQALSQTEVLVLETSLFEFMRGAPQFGEVVGYLKHSGFAVYDIILGWNRPLDNALGQVDLVSVKENGRFRRDHSFATPGQIVEVFRDN